MSAQYNFTVLVPFDTFVEGDRLQVEQADPAKTYQLQRIDGRWSGRVELALPPSKVRERVTSGHLETDPFACPFCGWSNCESEHRGDDQPTEYDPVLDVEY